MLLVSVCVSCASKPIIDTANVDMEQYERDLADCEHVATQVDTGGKAVKSAAAGAAIGAALGAVWGDVGTSAAGGAVSGEYTDMIKAGILDPTKVVRTAAQARTRLRFGCRPRSARVKPSRVQARTRLRFGCRPRSAGSGAGATFSFAEKSTCGAPSRVPV